MTNMAKGTSLTGCWLRQASGQGYDQTSRQRLAQYVVEAALDDPQSLMLLPLEMMRLNLEVAMLREWGIACGIYDKHAQELDNAYLSHVERFEGTVRNTVDKAIKKFQDGASR